MCGIITQLQKEQNGGSGIGLSIAQAVAEAYGGKLKSAVKMGSRFCSRLPYKKLSMFIKVLQDSLRENIQTVLLNI